MVSDIAARDGNIEKLFYGVLARFASLEDTYKKRFANLIRYTQAKLAAS